MSSIGRTIKLDRPIPNYERTDPDADYSDLEVHWSYVIIENCPPDSPWAILARQNENPDGPV